FFSSRRRHTRFSRDWSSDVCSSDLQQISREQLQEIFRLSRTRITGLNRSFALDDEEEKIFDLARMSGLVGVATIGGKVCGGMIRSEERRVGKEKRDWLVMFK